MPSAESNFSEKELNLLKMHESIEIDGSMYVYVYYVHSISCMCVCSGVTDWLEALGQIT